MKQKRKAKISDNEHSTSSIFIFVSVALVLFFFMNLALSVYFTIRDEPPVSGIQTHTAINLTNEYIATYQGQMNPTIEFMVEGSATQARIILDMTETAVAIGD